jgi:hypothetical protein
MIFLQAHQLMSQRDYDEFYYEQNDEFIVEFNDKREVAQIDASYGDVNHYSADWESEFVDLLTSVSDLPPPMIYEDDVFAYL